jgi:malonyl-CoA/methylmalonyl-CoA synthetase
MLKIFENAAKYPNNTAIIADGISYNYQTLLSNAQALASSLLHENIDLNEARVAFMANPGFEYVTMQWAIWQAGGIVVPLCISYPLPSLQYVLENTQANIIITTAEFEQLIAPLAIALKAQLIVYSAKNFTKNNNINLPNLATNRRAMILFTSGTTNLPKGVVTTHANIEAQVSTLITAWRWSQTDHILCVLPLHHVHGIINVVACALWAGAAVEFLPNYSEEAVFKAFSFRKINLFMAVPTIYFKLIAYWEKQDSATQLQIKNTLGKFRLMVSGSAALPVSVLEKWEKISNHTLLERYGMTEIGMGISNPYIGERKPGSIGKPLPGVGVRLVDENNIITTDNLPGEIQIKSESVFLEYWNKPSATKEAFTDDGWFKTGDIAIVEKGYYKILGRDSVDIIKSGGYKISALEIEEILRTFPEIIDCSVVGIANDEWGEIVAAALITNNKPLNTKLLNDYMRAKLPAYKCPRLYKSINELPKNAMGKVVKSELKAVFE